MWARPHASRLLAYAALVVTLWAPAVQAQRSPSAPSTEEARDARKEAARKFAEGTKAFDAGDFTRAGEAFEAAYRLAPHEDPLWNAARAWHRAGELARAANLYAKYLRDASPNAAGRGSVTSALTQLSTKLCLIELHVGAGVDEVTIDDAHVEAPTIYVVPGTHIARARSAKGPVEQRLVGVAGQTISVVLEESEPVRPAPITPAPSASAPLVPAPQEVAPGQKPFSGWSPIVVAIGGGLTAVATGFAIWSGLDTLGTLHEFESGPTRPLLESGRSQEIRTNVLIGTSIGLAVITAVTALWLVDWHRGNRSTQVGRGLTSAMRGLF